MKREKILHQLQQYQNEYPLEKIMCDRFIDFVQSNPKCFLRELQIGHITGSAWLVDESGKNVLLTHHRKLNIWIQPGGHSDGNSNILEVALQEAVEETGLTQLQVISNAIFDIDIHEIPLHKTTPAHYHYDVRYALRALGSTDFIVSDESHDLAWVPVQNMADYNREESMMRMARKWLARR